MRLIRHLNEKLDVPKNLPIEGFYTKVMGMFKNTKRINTLTWEIKAGLEEVAAAFMSMKPKKHRHETATKVSNPTYMFEFPGNHIVTIYAKTPGVIHVQILDYNKFKEFLK